MTFTLQAEHVLTCETNLKCLEEVLDLPVISGHEAHQIEGELLTTTKRWSCCVKQEAPKRQPSMNK